MPRLELQRLDASHVPEAARLLAARHRQQRTAQPLMSERFEDEAVTAREVEEALTRADASGAVAVRAGRVVGFLLGAPKPDPVWGPNLWVESAGQALDPGEERETMRDLYAFAATRWREEGRTAHYVVTPATDRGLLDAWWRLGFGQQQAHAVRGLPEQPPRVQGPLVVRPASREDIPALARLEVELPRHQGRAPTFSSGELGSVEESTAEWEEDFDDPRFTTFVAERSGLVIGSAVACALELSSSNSGLIRPERAGFLGFAAVLPEHRGVGAGRALGEAAMGWCRQTGFSCIATDWRVTNLLSSRAWTSMGFEQTFLRLHRLIGF